MFKISRTFETWLRVVLITAGGYCALGSALSVAQQLPAQEVSAVAAGLGLLFIADGLRLGFARNLDPRQTPYIPWWVMLLLGLVFLVVGMMAMGNSSRILLHTDYPASRPAATTGA